MSASVSNRGGGSLIGPSLAVEYRLDSDGLTVRTTATNIGASACPCGAGAHPYLTVGTPSVDSIVLQAPGLRDS